MQLNAKKIPALSVFILIHLAWLFMPIVLFNWFWQDQMPDTVIRNGILICAIMLLGVAKRRFDQNRDTIELQNGKVKGPSHTGWFSFHSKTTEISLSNQPLKIKYYDWLNVSLVGNKDNWIRVVHRFYEPQALASFIAAVKANSIGK